MTEADHTSPFDSIAYISERLNPGRNEFIISRRLWQNLNQEVEAAYGSSNWAEVMFREGDGNADFNEREASLWRQRDVREHLKRTPLFKYYTPGQDKKGRWRLVEREKYSRRIKSRKVITVVDGKKIPSFRFTILPSIEKQKVQRYRS